MFLLPKIEVFVTQCFRKALHGLVCLFMILTCGMCLNSCMEMVVGHTHSRSFETVSPTGPFSASDYWYSHHAGYHLIYKNTDSAFVNGVDSNLTVQTGSVDSV